MNDETQDNLDAALAEHLHGRLAAQLGRASGVFEAHVNAQRSKDAARRNRRAWIVATFPAALAACIALVAAVGYWRQGHTNDAVVAESPKAGAYDHATYYRDLDDGTIMVDSESGPVPVRAIRRQEISETQWVNPKDQTKYSVRVPREKTVYVNLQPF